MQCIVTLESTVVGTGGSCECQDEDNAHITRKYQQVLRTSISLLTQALDEVTAKAAAPAERVRSLLQAPDKRKALLAMAGDTPLCPCAHMQPLLRSCPALTWGSALAERMCDTLIDCLICLLALHVCLEIRNLNMYSQLPMRSISQCWTS